jgi:hypothetical protein
MSFFGVRSLITSFSSWNSSCLSFLVYGHWLLLLYIQAFLACSSLVYAPDYSFFLSASSSCMSFFGVRSLITPLYLQTFLACPFSVFGPWLLLLHLQTLLVCPSSVYGPHYSFCIFKLFVYIFLRCTTLITSFASSNSSCMFFFGVRPLITPFVSLNFLCMSFYGVRPLITPFVS